MNIIIERIRAAWTVLTTKGGVVIFHEEPVEGDTITVGRMKATFIREDDLKN